MEHYYTSKDIAEEDKEEIKDFFIKGINGLITVTAEDNEIVGFNARRAKLILQNQGIEPVLLKINGLASIDNYDYILKASSRARLGDGGVFETNSIKVSINAITETGESTLSILEEVFQ